MRGFAHPGGPLAPHDLWSAWNLELSLLIPLGITVCVYLWGVRNIWARAGAGHGITASRCAAFAGAMLALVAALVSPLDAMSENLFSAHMVQHLVLILVAAPLLILSDVPLALLWALPRRWSQALAQRFNQSQTLTRLSVLLFNPVFAWLLFTIALWSWHVPTFYQAALGNETIHVLEHSTFLATAALFWWVLFRHSGNKSLHYGMAVAYLFTTALQSGILGALMTFTSEPWYPYYAALVRAWGLTPLEDQQLAGLVMWLPGGAVFTLLTIGYFAAWFGSLEQRSVRLRQRDSL